MYQSEKQFNTTASEHTIEEVYTNLDIAPNDMYLPYDEIYFLPISIFNVYELFECNLKINYSIL